MWWELKHILVVEDFDQIVELLYFLSREFKVLKLFCLPPKPSYTYPLLIVYLPSTPNKLSAILFRRASGGIWQRKRLTGFAGLSCVMSQCSTMQLPLNWNISAIATGAIPCVSCLIGRAAYRYRSLRALLWSWRLQPRQWGCRWFNLAFLREP
jgi:hypothetical protein